MPDPVGLTTQVTGRIPGRTPGISSTQSVPAERKKQRLAAMQESLTHSDDEACRRLHRGSAICMPRRKKSSKRPPGFTSGTGTCADLAVLSPFQPTIRRAE